MKRGHQARKCRANVTCSNCRQDSHHVSLCESKDKQLTPNAREFEVLPEREDAKPSALSPSMHVGLGGRVALRTARVVIRGEGDPCRVRVLFDADSHRSFITSKAAQRSQLPVIRQDWLGISTFGQRSQDTRLRDVVDSKISPVGGYPKYQNPELPTNYSTSLRRLKS